MIRKTANFIYNLFRKPICWVRTTHQKALQVDTDDLPEITRNPYQVFLDWLLEVAIYGTIISTTTFVLFNTPTNPKTIPIFIIATGLLRWLLIDTIKSVKQIF